MKNCILITGGTGLLGSEIARKFAHLDWSVIITTRNYNKFKNSALCEFKNIHAIEVDFDKDDFCNRIGSYLLQNELYPITLVNNVRNLDYTAVDDDGKVSTKNWIGEFQLAVIVPYKLSLLLMDMKYSRLSSIINIGSMYGSVAPNKELYSGSYKTSPIHYGVCKAALSHLTKELAVRLIEKEIRINTVSYGGVDGRVDDEFKKKYSKLCPSGKMLDLTEITGVLEFLADNDKSSSITGQNIAVDGGWTLW